MKRITPMPLALAIAGIVAAVSCASCRQLYTTSLAASLARDSVNISSRTKTSDLVALAKTDAAGDSALAKEVLEVLSGKDTTEITNLALDDKTAILNLATTATVKLSDLTAIAAEAGTDGADTDALIEKAFDAFDNTVQLGAVQTLLADRETLEQAPVETLVLASAVVAADVAKDIGTGLLMEILEQDNPDISALPADQQAKIELVLNVKTALDQRSAEDLEATSIGGFNLADLLGGSPI